MLVPRFASQRTISPAQRGQFGELKLRTLDWDGVDEMLIFWGEFCLLRRNHERIAAATNRIGMTY